jgi:transposase
VDHFGIDLHQKHSEICGMDASGKVKIQERVATSEAGLRKVFGKRKSCRVVLENGGQSSWAARLLVEMGHEVVVVNPRRIRLIAESTLKTDRIDAEILARLAREDERLFTHLSDAADLPGLKWDPHATARILRLLRE